MRIFHIILSLLRFRTELRLGLSKSAKGPVHAFISKDKKTGNITALSSGLGISSLVKLFAPPGAQADLAGVPVYFTTADIGNEAPESWIDRNEEIVIPAGTTADRIVNEYTVEGKTLFSSTVSKNALEEAIAERSKEFPLHALASPLWNLAKLYGREIKSPFILWRIASDGSTLGVVQNGFLRRLVNGYVDCDDLKNDQERSLAFIEHLVNALADNDLTVPIIIFSPEADFALPDGCAIKSYSYGTAPLIKGIPGYAHEAYANACRGDPDLNFLPFEQMKKMNLLHRRYWKLRAGVRWVVLGAFFLLLLGALTDGVVRLTNHVYSDQMEQMRTEGEVILAAERRRDALVNRYQEKQKFTSRRSRCTALLAELQTVLPEGMWAENVSIVEINGGFWQCDIQGMTPTSSLIGEVLDTLNKVPGISNARMTFSEQVTLPNRHKAIRFKIKTDWK